MEANAAAEQYILNQQAQAIFGIDIKKQRTI